MLHKKKKIINLVPKKQVKSHLWDLITDDRGVLDTGRLLTPIVIIWMLAIQTYAVVLNHQVFDGLQLGGGIAAVLAGLAAYLFGDKKKTDVDSSSDIPKK